MRLGQARRGVLQMMSSQVSVAIFQGLQFLLIARSLGAHEFGRMAGVLAITSALLPFSGLGAGSVAIMRISRKELAPSVCYGNALLTAAVSGLLLVAVCTFLGPVFLRDPSLQTAILVFAVSELMVTKFVDISGQIHLGMDRPAFAGGSLALHSLVRALMALVFFVASPSGGVMTWAWFHLAAGLISLIVVSLLTISQTGRPAPSIAGSVGEIRTGVFFSIGLSSKSVYTDIDKAVLARYASPEISGAYTAAFRVIYMAFTPIMALMIAMQTRIFREGAARGLPATVGFSNRLVRYGLVYCLAFAVLVFILAPMVMWALGQGFALSTEIVKTLAFLPVALMVQSVYSDALMGADRQRIRSVAQVTVALLCFGLNMWLVPRMSWHGAVVSTYASQLVLVALVGGIIAFSLQREDGRSGKRP